MAEIDYAEQEESYRILAVLEALATGLALERMTEEDLARVGGLGQAFAACGEGDPAAAELNRAFHFGIYECARSPLLLSLMRLLWATFTHRRQLWRPHAESVGEHRALVKALAVRDTARAEEITRDHVLGSIDWMQRARAVEREGLSLEPHVNPIGWAGHDCHRRVLPAEPDRVSRAVHDRAGGGRVGLGLGLSKGDRLRCPTGKGAPHRLTDVAPHEA